MKALLTWLRQEPGLKIVSLALALLLWAWRSSESNPVEHRRFASLVVQLRNLAPNLQPVTDPPLITVVLSGPRRTLNQLQAMDSVQPVVDCSELTRPTWRTLPVQVSTPEGVEVVSVEPDAVELDVDRVVTEVRPVQVAVGQTAPPPGYVYEAPQPARDQVAVRGPEKTVSRVAAVVAAVNLTGRSRSFTGSWRLRAVDAAGGSVTGVELEPTALAVSVQIARVEESRRLRVEVPFVNQPPAGFRLERYTVEPAEVTVSGQTHGMGATGKAILTQPVDLAGRRSEFEREVPLVVPRGAAAEPRTVKVRVTVSPAPER